MLLVWVRCNVLHSHVQLCVHRWFHHCALVLCPKMELAEQVAATAQSLVTTSSANTGTGSPQPLCSARVVSARNPPPPRAATDIVVSTPAALCNLLDEAGGAYGAQWEAENLAQCVRHVVADEADALFTSDSFLKPLARLLDVRFVPFLRGWSIALSCWGRHLENG